MRGRYGLMLLSNPLSVRISNIICLCKGGRILMVCFMSCLCVSKCMKMIVISFHLQNMGTFKCLALRMCIMWWLCNMSGGNACIKIHNYCNFSESTNPRNKIYGFGIISRVSLNRHINIMQK